MRRVSRSSTGCVPTSSQWVVIVDRPAQMRNSKGQSPCLITAWMSVPCHPNPGTHRYITRSLTSSLNSSKGGSFPDHSLPERFTSALPRGATCSSVNATRCCTRSTLLVPSVNGIRITWVSQSESAQACYCYIETSSPTLQASRYSPRTVLLRASGVLCAYFITLLTIPIINGY